MKKLIDLSGKTFGRLTVVARAEGRCGASTWVCKCECGNTKTVASQQLRRGETRSCGCLRRDSKSWDGASGAWRKHRTVIVMGQEMTIEQAAVVANVDKVVLAARLASGMTGDQAVFYGEPGTPF